MAGSSPPSESDSDFSGFDEQAALASRCDSAARQSSCFSSGLRASACVGESKAVAEHLRTASRRPAEIECRTPSAASAAACHALRSPHHLPVPALHQFVTECISGICSMSGGQQSVSDSRVSASAVSAADVAASGCIEPPSCSTDGCVDCWIHACSSAAVGVRRCDGSHVRHPCNHNLSGTVTASQSPPCTCEWALCSSP